MFGKPCQEATNGRCQNPSLVCGQSKEVSEGNHVDVWNRVVLTSSCKGLRHLLA